MEGLMEELEHAQVLMQALQWDTGLYWGEMAGSGKK